MKLFDTSAWIEKLIGSPLGLKLDKELPKPELCIVPTLVQFELSKWLTRERSEEIANMAIAFTRTCHVVPLSTTIALSAAELSRVHSLAAADAIIYATSLRMDAELITCDAHFADLPGVRYFAKNLQMK